MPFCPECGAEYREGFDRCSECDVPLVNEPPSTSESEGPVPDEEWVPVAAFTTVEEAELACGLLHAEGIRAEIVDKDMHVQPFGRGILDEVGLLVPRADLARAEAALDQADAGQDELSEDEPETAETPGKGEPQ